MSNNVVSLLNLGGCHITCKNTCHEIDFLQIWCNDVISQVTMSKSAFHLCVRAGIEQLESTSHISKGSAIEHAALMNEYRRVRPAKLTNHSARTN